ncbi:cation:proton antiporter domain-containing protein [Mycolicibacterium pyrenivorans]|uniref:cation:proton antiporter domain-containing protein n=1 Tax=Mycolicibacterium pyrenivorans TaxID=187102 RepID=UPI0021F35E5D|nr:cation:proton antiporter [Mycolicibacterium pyrenivorans]MCV7153353.1 cation:proton antiporter [Mycolicibacterium pyrenivorans]
MELDIVLAAVGLLGVVVATMSAKMRSLPISEPLLGLTAGIVLGPQVTGVFTFPSLAVEQSVLHEASRILLAISVMAVALRYPFGDIRRHGRALLILLLIVLPVMALVSAGLGWAILGMPVAAAALFGAAISPTDPVLASSVVTGEAAERDLPARDRQLLSVESGSNDGLALPLVLVALAVAGPLGAGDAFVESVWQVAGGVALGAGIGWLGGRALRLGARHGAAVGAPALFFTVVLALGILGAAGLLRVDGVLAVFVGGVAFNIVGTGSERAAEVPIDEAINRFAVLPLFVLFGAALPWRQWHELGWQVAVLVLAVLVLRRIPIVLLMKRPLRLRTPDALYLGWFGPVGVSALFYLTLEADRLGANETVLAAGSLVLACSTIAFGVTGVLGRTLYRRVAVQAPADER